MIWQATVTVVLQTEVSSMHSNAVKHLHCRTACTTMVLVFGLRGYVDGITLFVKLNILTAGRNSIVNNSVNTPIAEIIKGSYYLCRQLVARFFNYFSKARGFSECFMVDLGFLDKESLTIAQLIQRMFVKF